MSEMGLNIDHIVVSRKMNRKNTKREMKRK